MGKGLQISRSGIHVAFAGGTGALVFLDLVSRIILNNLLLLPSQFEKDFEFHFYASFRSEESSIGVELCNKLTLLNEKLGLANFKFIPRLAEGPQTTKRPPRWDEDFIEKTLLPHAGKIKRVWVCGAPIMNQVFDMSFETLAEKL